jgi:hypothetical protein
MRIQKREVKSERREVMRRREARLGPRAKRGDALAGLRVEEFAAVMLGLQSG